MADEAKSPSLSKPYINPPSPRDGSDSDDSEAENKNNKKITLNFAVMAVLRVGAAAHDQNIVLPFFDHDSSGATKIKLE